MDYGYIKKRARELRKNQTPAENIVWEILRNRKFHGMKFLRQHPIECEINGTKHFFIADFYCAERKLVLELDGKVHDSQQERDVERDMMIKKLGIHILRVKNEEIQDMSQLKRKIESALGFLISPSLLIERGAGGE